MDIDRISDDGGDSSPNSILNLALVDHNEDSNHNHTSVREEIDYNAPLAIAGPSYSGSALVPLHSNDLVPMTRRQQQRQRKRPGTIELGLDHSETQAEDAGEGSSEPKRAVINVNESIVTLLLRLHSKYSGRPDSYVPKTPKPQNPKTPRYTFQLLIIVNIRIV